ncbi:hypothetical protein [Oceanospirillum sp.]|uniref:hypothetical protein n=1 Tax=Oceanospirillum sp. TaxID=2021254 RepID=UPI003A91FAB1
MDESQRGAPAPSREFTVDALQVKEIRKATGPAKSLLRALRNDPVHCIKALSDEDAVKAQ